MAAIIELATGSPAGGSAPAFGHAAPGIERAGAAARALATALLAVYLVLYHVYIGVYGAPTNAIFLPVHLQLALALVFLLNPLARRLVAIDVACLAGTAVLLAYFLSIIDTWEMLYVGLAPRDVAMGLLLLALLVEAVRRTVGWAMIVLAAVFCVHALFADWFPGALRGPPVRPESLIQTLVIGDAGVFGIPLLVAAQYIVLFLLFGRLLQTAGAGTFFTRIAFAVFGHRVGGPAKAGVIASGLFGTMSGSGVSNVLTTGAFTIPMMRQLGYRAPFAGGVEAAAAVGGSIMPPVMGAVAFMMAEFMGVDYLQVVLAAAIPAFLYYFAIYWTVHFEARKAGLGRLPKTAMPNPWRIIWRHGYLGIPLVMIAVMLAMGYSIILVALLTSLGTFLLSFASPATRLAPSRLADAFEQTGRVACVLSVTCACAGIIIGAMFATGLGFQITQIVLGLVKGQLWAILLISALISLLLGTGLTASAVYITMVATVIPILKASGVPDMAAHMFAFYYGVVSDITPPTALAAVAAAGLARANPMSTMLEASRLGIAAFIVPVLFVFQPALLLVGSPLEVVVAALAASAGLILFAAALAGHLDRPLPGWRRAALFAGGMLLIGGDWRGALAAAALTTAAMLGAPRARRLDAARGNPGVGPAAAVDPPEQARQAPSGMFGRWLAGRVRKEEAEAARELAEQGGAAVQSADLIAWLNDDRIGTEEAPRDSRRWSAWCVIAVGVMAVGAIGERSLHAMQPLMWLAALAAVTLWLVGGLIVTLRAPLSTAARRTA